MPDVLYAFTLTLLAGLATAVGGLIAFKRGGVSPEFLAGSMGFSAGAMLFVSLGELFADARETLTSTLGEDRGGWAALTALFAGILLIATIDRLVPPAANPHEPSPEGVEAEARAVLMRAGAFTAAAIFIHNIPEGFATFIVAMENPALAIPVAAAIAIHNIPEGIAVAVPIRVATGLKTKGFSWALFSGLAEPIGALVGFALLMPFLSETLLGVAFAMVAGVMVFVCIDELMPTAHRYDVKHIPVYGMVTGMLVMGGSLQLL